MTQRRTLPSSVGLATVRCLKFSIASPHKIFPSPGDCNPVVLPLLKISPPDPFIVSPQTALTPKDRDEKFLFYLLDSTKFPLGMEIVDNDSSHLLIF